ncbi:hypothetical protein [Neolewinella persica]|uniref:hypothetical protein n=1 Tax=Neolewinella persica TaxID=70998 RepID=UPI00035C238C|nr:hypothetical protein [Neolewinella persica]
MRSLFTSVCFSLLTVFLSTGSVAAQITINNDNFIRPSGFIDSSYSVPRSMVPPPVTGENLTWDYSDLTYDSTYYREFIAGMDTLLPTALNYTEAGIYFGALQANSQTWEGQSVNGYSDLIGITIQDTTFNITPLTGGPTDNFHIVGGTIPYTNGGANSLPFPITFGSQWDTEYSEVINYDITVAAFGLNSVPGTIREDVAVSREVVGYGRVRLPGVGDDPDPFYDVLLVKLTRTSVDSAFLGGAPAPVALLNAFMFTQGEVTRDTAFLFYGLGEFGVALINHNLSNGQVFFRPVGGNLTSTYTLRLLESNVYPNPIVAGDQLIFEVPEGLPAGTQLQLIGMDGRLTFQKVLTTRQAARIEVSLPTGLPAAPYVYTVRSANGQLLVSGKLEVR